MSLLKVAGTTASSGTLYVNDVFSVYLYTGNGSTQTITNGIDLAGKGGLVWIKSRSAATDHKLTDTVRGTTKALISDTTDAQTTDANGLTAFNSTGFSLGTDSVYNTNAATYVSWTFRKAAKFFDVVTYTGTGSAQTIAHNLGVAPGMIIVKRTDTVSDWVVYHIANYSAYYNNVLYLNKTGATIGGTNAWNSTPATASQFYVGAGGTYGNNSASGGTYVAYLFAHDTSSTGIIQCGSFTADASGNATVNLGWEPQYLMFKKTNVASDWATIDTMRGWNYQESRQLKPNLSDAENAPLYCTPNATGFATTTGGFDSNSTYIYMAIRRPNKPPTSGTQVFGLNARTGTGANATVAGGQTDDAVLIKNRGSAVGDLFASRLTGTGYLETSSTAAEVAAGTTILQANPWDVMDGVKVGTTSTITNASANTFINYFFKRAPGFFDEVCYTGTGVDRTVNHNLTVAPELIIVKARSSLGNYWKIYFGSITTALFLNTNDAVLGAGGTWGTTAPTSTIFWVGGSYGDVNGNGKTYVAYLFATLAGISKIGSYTGNGSTGQAIACGFSAGARFVLIKRTDSTGDWYTFDSARGLTSGSSPYLLLNSTAAETTGNNGVYASTGGFTLGSTASTTTNINAATYIFLAVA